MNCMKTRSIAKVSKPVVRRDPELGRGKNGEKAAKAVWGLLGSANEIIHGKELRKLQGTIEICESIITIAENVVFASKIIFDLGLCCIFRRKYF